MIKLLGRAGAPYKSNPFCRYETEFPKDSNWYEVTPWQVRMEDKYVGYEPLTYATFRGKKKAVKALLELGAPIDGPPSNQKIRELYSRSFNYNNIETTIIKSNYHFLPTALCIAVDRLDVELIELFSNHRANVNAKDWCGTKIFHIFKAKLAEIEKQDRPCELELYQKLVKIFKLLIDHGLDPKLLEEYREYTSKPYIINFPGVGPIEMHLGGYSMLKELFAIIDKEKAVDNLLDQVLHSQQPSLDATPKVDVTKVEILTIEPEIIIEPAVNTSQVSRLIAEPASNHIRLNPRAKVFTPMASSCAATPIRTKLNLGAKVFTPSIAPADDQNNQQAGSWQQYIQDNPPGNSRSIIK
jgi:hypothetical protein